MTTEAIDKALSKPVRLIYCPGPNRWVTIGQYVTAVKYAMENPGATFKQGLTTWWPVTGAEIVRQFHDGVFDRINQGIPAYKRGIK